MDPIAMAVIKAGACITEIRGPPLSIQEEQVTSLAVPPRWCG